MIARANTGSDRVFGIVNGAFLALVLLAVLYPVIYVLSASFSSSYAVISGQVWLFPVDLSLMGYRAVFRHDAVWRGYFNSGFYMIVGTLVNVALTVMAAYPLSRRDFRARRVVMFVLTFTFLFAPPLIPRYLLVRDLGMLDTRLAMIIPNALIVFYVIITRTFFQTTIPDELLEAAKMDGCSDVRFIVAVVLPLSRSILAVVALWYAVGHWNRYFDALIYLKSASLQPLQIVLRNILIQNEIAGEMLGEVVLTDAQVGLAELLKYSLIVVASIPMLAIYPFVQKHFVKGVMVGSLKG